MMDVGYDGDDVDDGDESDGDGDDDDDLYVIGSYLMYKMKR